MRAHNWELACTPPIRTYDDITALGKEVVAKGFTALKTNIVIPGERARSTRRASIRAGENSDGVVTVQTLEQIDTLIGTFREAVGPDVGIALDLNYNFKTDGVQRIGKLLEPYRHAVDRVRHLGSDGAAADQGLDLARRSRRARA